MAKTIIRNLLLSLLLFLNLPDHTIFGQGCDSSFSETKTIRIKKRVRGKAIVLDREFQILYLRKIEQEYLSSLEKTPVEIPDSLTTYFQNNSAGSEEFPAYEDLFIDTEKTRYDAEQLSAMQNIVMLWNGIQN